MALEMHDPEGKVTLPLLEGCRGGASFYGPTGGPHDTPHPGDCWRTTLWREWGEPGAPYALFLGMNPSTARGDVDDMTIRKDQGFTRRMGLTAYRKGNVSAYRLTPSQKLTAPSLPLYCRWNLPDVLAAAQGAAKVVLAFGSVAPVLRPMAQIMVDELRSAGIDLWCLGTTADGSPCHTSRIGYERELEPWEGWQAAAPVGTLSRKRMVWV